MANNNGNNPNPNNPFGTGPQRNIPKPNPKKTETHTVGLSPEDQLKKLISQMADSDPANIAEIIHQWLSEDNK